MSDARETQPRTRLIDLRLEVDLGAAAEAFATDGRTVVGRGARCLINEVAYRSVSATRIGRTLEPARAKPRDPKHPYDVPPGWFSPAPAAM